MHRVAGPRPEVIRPLRPAPDALSKWLAFHAYRVAVGLFVQGQTLDELIARDLADQGALGQRYGGADPTAPITFPEVTVEVAAATRTVVLRAPDGTWRAARHHGRYGCVILPEGSTELPLPAHPAPAAPATPTAGRPWPLGGEVDLSALPEHVDLAAIQAAADEVTGDGRGRALVVAYDGRLIAESYAPPYHRDFRHPSWSMTKSLAGALIGRLVQLGHLALDQPVPIQKWRRPDDPRADITIDDLLRMSSGLDCPGGITPWADGDRHFRVYSGLADVAGYVAELPVRAKPGTRCAYQNCDAVVAATVIREVARAIGTHPADAPWSLLFEPVGMDPVLHADAHGTFILSGFSTATALDWARFGQLHLDDGRWQGRRLLPEGWLDLAMTPAPADDEPVYGGAFLWLGNRVLGERLFSSQPSGAHLPRFAMAAGHYGQRTIIMPSHRLVIVRMGHGLDDDLLVRAVERIVTAVSR